MTTTETQIPSLTKRKSLNLLTTVYENHRAFSPKWSLHAVTKLRLSRMKRHCSNLPQGHRRSFTAIETATARDSWAHPAYIRPPFGSPVTLLRQWGLNVHFAGLGMSEPSKSGKQAPHAQSRAPLLSNPRHQGPYLHKRVTPTEPPTSISLLRTDESSLKTTVGAYQQTLKAYLFQWFFFTQLAWVPEVRLPSTSLVSAAVRFKTRASVEFQKHCAYHQEERELPWEQKKT